MFRLMNRHATGETVEELQQPLDAFRDALEDVLDVIGIEALPADRAVRIVVEADSDEARDRAVIEVASAYQYAVYTFGDVSTDRFEIEIHPAEGSGYVTFTVRREWLPVDRDDAEGWNEMLARINDTHEVGGHE